MHYMVTEHMGRAVSILQARSRGSIKRKEIAELEDPALHIKWLQFI